MPAMYGELTVAGTGRHKESKDRLMLGKEREGKKRTNVNLTELRQHKMGGPSPFRAI